MAFGAPAEEVLTLDPAGDSTGIAPVRHDVLRTVTTPSKGRVQFAITFADSVAPAALHAPRSVYGYLDLDIDQEPLTGVNDRFGQATTRAGIDYIVDLFDTLGVEADILDAKTFLPVGVAALGFQDSTLSIGIPLSLVGNDDGRFNWGFSVGTLTEENDRSLGTAVPEPASVVLAVLGLPLFSLAAYYQRPWQPCRVRPGH